MVLKWNANQSSRKFRSYRWFALPCLLFETTFYGWHVDGFSGWNIFFHFSYVRCSLFIQWWTRCSSENCELLNICTYIFLNWNAFSHNIYWILDEMWFGSISVSHSGCGQLKRFNFFNNNNNHKIWISNDGLMVWISKYTWDYSVKSP